MEPLDLALDCQEPARRLAVEAGATGGPPDDKTGGRAEILDGPACDGAKIFGRILARRPEPKQQHISHGVPRLLPMRIMLRGGFAGNRVRVNGLASTERRRRLDRNRVGCTAGVYRNETRAETAADVSLGLTL